MNDYYPIPLVNSTALNELCFVVNDWATKKGWNEAPDDLSHKAEQIALMHSELSECLEYLRTKPTQWCHSCGVAVTDNAHPEPHVVTSQPVMDDKVPSLTGEAAELADVLIRIFHYCGKRNINLGEAVRLKHEFNITRPYRHGKNC